MPPEQAAFLYRPFGIADVKEQDNTRGLNRAKTMFVKGTVTMKKEDFIALGLADDLAKKCADASAEELKGFIPKARFDEVNTEKKNLETAVSERDKQLETLKNSTGDVESLKKQIAELQTANAEQLKQHEREVKQLKTDAAIDAALNSARAKNNTAVKALLKDLDKAEFAEDGTIKGLSEQIKGLKKSDPYLFDDNNAKPVIRGAVPGETGVEDGDRKVDTSKMTYSEMCAYLAQNPGVNLEQA